MRSLPTPSRRRVLLVINDLGAGGAQRAALDQAAGLDAERFEVEVASLGLEPPSDGRDERYLHVPIHRGPRRGLGPGLRALDRTVRRFEPDLIHGHLVLATLAATLWGHARGVPRKVATFHNLTDWEEKRRHPLRLAARHAVRGCDAVVVVSEAVRAAMAHVDPVLARRAHRIGNGVELRPFERARLGRREARARWQLADEDLVVGAVARFDPRKGLDLLVAAVAEARRHLPRLRLLLVGDGRERARLIAQVQALGLDSVVQFCGEQSDVAPCLAAMDVFAAPSRTEGQGLALIEAMATGLPVIATRVGGIPEVVAHRRSGLLVDPESPSALAQAIVELARSPERLAVMAAEARARASHFSLSDSCARLARLYDALLAPAIVEAAA